MSSFIFRNFYSPLKTMKKWTKKLKKKKSIKTIFLWWPRDRPCRKMQSIKRDEMAKKFSNDRECDLIMGGKKILIGSCEDRVRRRHHQLENFAGCQ